MSNAEQYYIVRGKDSGVFFGKVKERIGAEVTMENVRNIWYWEGAFSLCEMAKDGATKPQNCKFTVFVDKLTIIDAIEMLPCTEKATQVLSGVKEWKQR